MGPAAIVFSSPAFDCSSGVLGCQKPGGVQTLIPKTTVEAFHVTVLHRATGLYMDDRDAALFAPLEEVSAGEFRTVVTSNAFRCAVFSDRFLQCTCDSLAGKAGGHFQSRTLSGKPIHYCEDTDSTATR